MTNNNHLNVWYKDILVGQLSQNSVGLLHFQYEKDWINIGFPISQQLPLEYEVDSSESVIAHQFFVNLLPEADARARIVRDLKISNSDFELIKAIGGECAGALSILPLGHRPDQKSTYQKLSSEDLNKILMCKGQVFSLTSEKDRPRLSLAGAHDKCPILYDDQHYYLPKDAAPSTHILKFEIRDYKNIPVYEYFMAMLAKSVGLPVVDIQLNKHNREYFLLIKRYDRIISNHMQVERIHQEDYCQALGFGFQKKYQLDGGPSFEDCYSLTNRVSTNPVIDSENLLCWQIFNVLSGNSDGHAKNISLLYNDIDQVELAPFYDLVCTRAIEHIDSKLAMSVGGEFNPDKITIQHWQLLATHCNLGFQYLEKLIKAMAIGLRENFSLVLEEFEASFGPYPALQRIERIVSRQCKKTLKQLN